MRTMNLPVIAASASVAQATSFGASLRRRLSFQHVAGYQPGSQVTDHCAIDLDQKAIEEQLAIKTPESFNNARRIYNEGGNSKSYARISLQTENGLPFAVNKGERILGKNADGLEVSGKAYDNYSQGATQIEVQYTTTDIQSEYVGCQVGALQETNTKGCLKSDGDVTINGRDLPYTYDVAEDNDNGRTIAGFSEGDNAKNKMRVTCKGCPYDDFMYFYNYYGTDEYAHQMVEAAFEGKSTSFTNGNADFSRYGLIGKEQIIKKATAYMNIFMYVIREFEDALDDCESRCVNCNEGSVHAWDEGVCFYTGSIEGEDGLTADGKLLHQLADKRCENFKTCGAGGQDVSGTAKLNYDIMSLFSVGNFQIRSGNCPAARSTTREIITKMYVPMIQGTLRYAYKVGALSGGEKEKAEGAIFAAAVLPRVHAISPKAADTIYNNMRVGAPSTSYTAVKAAFESVYAAMGVDCADIGGLWNDATNTYYEGMEPCASTVGSLNTEVVKEQNTSLAIALGCTFGALFAIAAAMVLYMRSREKEGKPVFQTSVHQEEGVKDMN